MERGGIFAGRTRSSCARRGPGGAAEPNDPNRIALATVDAAGLPRADGAAKEIEAVALSFLYQLTSAKGKEMRRPAKTAFVRHGRRCAARPGVRGTTTRERAAGDADTPAAPEVAGGKGQPAVATHVFEGEMMAGG